MWRDLKGHKGAGLEYQGAEHGPRLIPLLRAMDYLKDKKDSKPLNICASFIMALLSTCDPEKARIYCARALPTTPLAARKVTGQLFGEDLSVRLELKESQN